MNRNAYGWLASVLIAAAALTPAVSLSDERSMTMAKPDPQMQAVLDQLAALGGKPIETLSPAEARRQPTPADAVKAVMQKRGMSIEPETVGKVEDRTIQGPSGAIPIRIYTPEGKGPFPVLTYWHGGGWVIANLDTYDSSCRALTNAAQCIVVSCHYRQAPENRFPAASDDALAAYQWVVRNATRLGGDPGRIAVGGESAGGNLATVTAMRARETGTPMPVYQLLVYPVTNHAFDTPSYRQYADAKPLSGAMMKWFWNHYVGRSNKGDDPHASPMRARDVSKLPPAMIITAEIDPLQSEGKAYADKLRAAGVDVAYMNFEGVTHEFFGMGAVVDKAKEAVGKAADGLRTGFAAAHGFARHPNSGERR